MASYKASARSLDQGVGSVLNALDEHDLADDTLVILTTDHGLAFPGAKGTLYDRGIGVLMIMRGPGGAHGGRVSNALVSHIDLFPTICELAGTEPPARLQGRSLLPVMRREVEDVNDAIFAELTYHAAYEPIRAVRTKRWKYIRRFADRLKPVLANVDDSPTKDLLIAEGWADVELPREALHDLRFDPVEAHNLIDAPHCAEIAEELRRRLDEWMRATDDPLLDGPVPAPEGAELNTADQVSPAEPVGTHVLDPAGSVH
jgi:N-sulfoglucosamine sulfohydrolase